MRWLCRVNSPQGIHYFNFFANAKQIALLVFYKTPTQKSSAARLTASKKYVDCLKLLELSSYCLLSTQLQLKQSDLLQMLLILPVITIYIGQTRSFQLFTCITLIRGIIVLTGTETRQLLFSYVCNTKIIKSYLILLKIE